MLDEEHASVAAQAVAIPNRGVAARGREPTVNRKPLPAVDRRRHERLTTPRLTVAFDGRTYETDSWSLGGFMIEGYDGRLTPGALFIIDGIGAGAAGLSPVSVRSRVVRAEPEHRRLMVAFLDVDHRAYGLLKHFMSERTRALKDGPAV